MKTTKLFIKNRKKEKIAVIIEEPKNSIGLAFVMHGRSGFKEQKQVQILARACKKNKYTTIRFDTTRSRGESAGKVEDTTFTFFYQDLEDVIKWAQKQKFYQEPFILIGCSIGATAVLIYNIKNKKKVKALAPISVATTGDLLREKYVKHKSQELKEWKEKGYISRKSESKPGIIKINFYFYLDTIQKKYNLIDKIDKIKVPVLLVVGSKELPWNIKYNQKIYQKLKSSKELHIIENAPHTLRAKTHLKQLYEISNKWLKKLSTNNN
jgi:esterase/lipase